MKRLLCLLMMCILLSGAVAALAAPEEGKHVTVATVDYSVPYWEQAISYPRVIELQHSGEHNGMLIATYELYSAQGTPGYNIHVSRDGGETWEKTAIVKEKDAALHSAWQPYLYELPLELGEMKAGTLLLAACSIDPGCTRRSELQIYRSFDQGKNWEQYSTIAAGGGSLTGVWEPFLMMLPDGRLACYYSDCTERESHSQKIVMRYSEDGVNWSRTMEIVALRDQPLRPGMSTVARMNDGRYIMTYEICHQENPGYGNPVYYRFSEDGIDWGNPADAGIKVVTDEGAVPGSCPYIAYLPGAGEKGLLLMTSAFQTPYQTKGNIVYINDNLGAEDAWRAWYQPKNYRIAPKAYSRAIFPASDGITAYFVSNNPDAKSTKGFYKMVFLYVTFGETPIQ